MIALLQRVVRASVAVDGEPIASIDKGLLVFVGAERDDTPDVASRLAERVMNYRVFGDARGRMNIDVDAAGGALLVVPQFTLVADTHKGNRPSFSTAAPPASGRALFEHFVKACAQRLAIVEVGQFGADMQVESVNDGPVTFWLHVAAR